MKIVNFENEFNDAVKKAASEEYKRVRKELLAANQNEAAEILGHDMRHYQRLESGEGTPNLSKHFSNIFTLLRHYAQNVFKDNKGTSIINAYEGTSDEEKAEQYAQEEARNVIMRVISRGGKND